MLIEDIIHSVVTVEDLNDENSVTFRSLIQDSVLSKSKVNENFEKTKIEVKNRSINITGYKKLVIESKLNISVKNKPYVIAAVRNMMSEQIHMKKMPTHKKKP